MALGKIPGLVGQLLNPPVGLSPAELLHKIQKGLLSLLVLVLQHLLHHIRPQKGQLSFIPNPETGVNVQSMIMVPNQVQAEAVDGGNLGLGNQSRLKPQMLILRLFGQFPVNGGPDSLPHLGRRRVGEGHHQKLVNAQRVFPLADHLDDPLH